MFGFICCFVSDQLAISFYLTFFWSFPHTLCAVSLSLVVFWCSCRIVIALLDVHKWWLYGWKSKFYHSFVNYRFEEEKKNFLWKSGKSEQQQKINSLRFNSVNGLNFISIDNRFIRQLCGKWVNWIDVNTGEPQSKWIKNDIKYKKERIKRKQSSEKKTSLVESTGLWMCSGAKISREFTNFQP